MLFRILSRGNSSNGLLLLTFCACVPLCTRRKKVNAYQPHYPSFCKLVPVALKQPVFLCTNLYTAKKSYFALSALSEFLLVRCYLRSCAIMYTAKKSYFALSALSEFLQACSGCSNKQPVFLCTTLYIAIPIQVATKKQPLIKGLFFCQITLVLLHLRLFQQLVRPYFFLRLYARKNKFHSRALR